MHTLILFWISLLTRQWRTIQGLLIATSFSFFWSNSSLQFEFPEKIMSHLQVYRLAAHGVLWCWTELITDSLPEFGLSAGPGVGLAEDGLFSIKAPFYSRSHFL